MSDQSINSTVVYKDIPGFPGYRVGDDGSVWSRFKRNGRNKRTLDGKWSERNPSIGKSGYKQLWIYNQSGRIQVALHVLILQIFICDRPEGKEAAHKNGNKLDCRLENLEWKTPKENIQDKYLHGTMVLGEKSRGAIVTSSQVIEIRKRRLNGETVVSLAKEFGMTESGIQSIVKRRSWKHI